MNEYSVLSVLFAPIVILLSALLATGLTHVFTALYLAASNWFAGSSPRGGALRRPRVGALPKQPRPA